MHDDFCRVPRPRYFLSGFIAVLFVFSDQFSAEVLSSQNEEPKKKNVVQTNATYVVLPPFGHLVFSGSVSLARVTPLFLAVTGFLSSFFPFVPCNTLDIYTKRNGCLRCTKKIAERVHVREVQSRSRDWLRPGGASPYRRGTFSSFFLRGYLVKKEQNPKPERKPHMAWVTVDHQ